MRTQDQDLGPKDSKPRAKDTRPKTPEPTTQDLGPGTLQTIT